MPHDRTAAAPALHGDAEFVWHALGRVASRIGLHDGGAAAIAALTLAAAGLIAQYAVIGLVVGLLTGGTIWRRARSRRTRAAAAVRVERAWPVCRNVVITAEEIQRQRGTAPDWVWSRVMREAAGHLRPVRPAVIVPLWHVFATLGLASGLVAALMMGAGPPASNALRATIASVSNAGRVAASAPLHVRVITTPPGYLGQPPREEKDPNRIDAIEGTVLRIVAGGGDGRWRIRFGSRALDEEATDGATAAAAVLSESGYVAIEPRESSAASTERRLIPVTVSPDHAPIVRVTTPGRDLVVADATRPVRVEASATDDFGLRSLEIRYTRVSGSGERFEFQDGTIPVEILRDTGSSWHAAGQIPLSALALQPGDAIIYRALARDGRSGDRGLSASDTFFIEIAAPGQIALEGLGMSPDQGRYALSEQMIVLRIQRLRARERVLTRPDLLEATASIAAEQRAVRANFIFLMGGEVEDENAEAARPNERADPGIQKTAQQEISTAVTEMSRVEQALMTPDTAAALAAARAAVDALQRAFGRNRYILRTIPTRSRVDPSRRLTGDLSTAGNWHRDLEPAAVDRETREARALLSALLDVAATGRARGSVGSQAFTSLAERALAIDPNDAVWQDVARRIEAARSVFLSGGDASTELAKAVAPVVARTNRDARVAQRPGTRRPAALLGAWVKELRK